MHLPVAHLEAGLRSHNRRMPEEHNRVLTDHAADLCLAPTEVAQEHLRREGLAERSIVVGDVMTDVLLGVRDEVGDDIDRVVSEIGARRGEYLVATIHRAENTDDPVRLGAIVEALAGLDTPVHLLAHPRLVAKAAQFGIDLSQGSLRTSNPLPYPSLIAAVLGSAGVVTDSGGLQKEAFLLRVPCTTVRTETEWTETVDLGWNVLTEDPAAIAAAVNRPHPLPTEATPYGDGNAAERVIQTLLEHAARV